MKTISSASLADIELELPIRAVTDDLASFSDRLSLSAGAEKGYASFAAETFGVGEIAERAIGHAVEISRFLSLAGTSDRAQVLYAPLFLLHGAVALRVASGLAEWGVGRAASGVLTGAALASFALALAVASRRSRSSAKETMASVC